jgi:hypothetical protein
MPNIPYLLVRHIPFTLESDTFSQLLSTDLQISLRNEPKKAGMIYPIQEAWI